MLAEYTIKFYILLSCTLSNAAINIVYLLRSLLCFYSASKKIILYIALKAKELLSNIASTLLRRVATNSN